MKPIRKLLLLAAAPIICTLASCSDDEDEKISSRKLLPEAIEYSWRNHDTGAGSNTTQKLTYDDKNRIVSISTSNTGSTSATRRNISYPGDDVIEVCTVKENAADVVVSYRTDKGVLYINDEPHGTVDTRGNLLTCDLWYDGTTTTFSYDKKGNIASETYHAWYDERTDTRYFTNDGRNGIFRYVQTPAWFLMVSRIIGEPGLYNNPGIEYGEYGPENVYWSYDCTYNEDDYPKVFIKNPVGVLGASGQRYDISYIEAK